MSEADEVRDYIQRKGWEIAKTEGQGLRKQIILKVCPLCGKEQSGRGDRNFYIAEETSLWNTYCCQKSGNLLTLKRELGDLDIASSPIESWGSVESARFAAKLKAARGSTWAGFELPNERCAPYFHERLLGGECPEALEYLLQDRKLTEETIKRFQLGVARRGYCSACQKQTVLKPGDAGDVCLDCESAIGNGAEYLAIPHKADGRVVNFKFRSLSGEKRFERWTNAPTVLFNADSLDGEFKRVIITEGEIDVMTMDQLGYPVAVSTGSAAKDLEDDWVEKLSLFDDVLVAYDSDDAGDDGAAKLMTKLGRYRCRRVQFPLKDPNDCLRAGIAQEEIKACVESAAAYDLGIVRPFSEYAEDLRQMRKRGPKMFGVQTRWLEFNRLLGGFRDGELTIVTGDTGSGKTTWTTNVGWDLARGDALNGRSATGVLIASFENSTKDEARKLAQMESNLGLFDMTDVDLEEAITLLSAMKMFFVDQHGSIPLDDLRDAIEYGVRRHGLWLVVLDHLHFFMEDADDERRMIDRTIREIKRWAVRLGIHIMLVVHPAKLRKINGVLQKVELDDLKGSSAIKQDADNVIRVWRERDSDRTVAATPFGEITTLKVRSDLGKEGSVGLEFDRKSLRFNDANAAPPAAVAPPVPPPTAEPQASFGFDETENKSLTIHCGDDVHVIGGSE